MFDASKTSESIPGFLLPSVKTVVGTGYWKNLIKQFCFLLRQKESFYSYFVKISAPVLVIKIVCSNCAAGRPSLVTVVQLSSHVILSMVPSVRTGSAPSVLTYS